MSGSGCCFCPPKNPVFAGVGGVVAYASSCMVNVYIPSTI
jgi:hypothetical protein